MTPYELGLTIVIVMLLIYIFMQDLRISRLQEKMDANFDYTWHNARNATCKIRELDEQISTLNGKHIDMGFAHTALARDVKKNQSYAVSTGKHLADLSKLVLAIAEKVEPQ